MIGSHDTFTYLKPCSSIYKLCSRWWKTQCKSIDEQYAFGVRLFDIRVCRDGNYWRLCHGIVNLRMTFLRIKDICNIMKWEYPDAIYRIVLEKVDNTDAKKFIDESRGLCNKFPNLWRVDIKSSKNWLGAVDNNNQNLYNRGYKFALVNVWSPPAYELHGFVTTSNFYKINLRKEAMKINKSLPFFNDKASLQKMIKDKKHLYFLDYCTNKY